MSDDSHLHSPLLQELERVVREAGRLALVAQATTSYELKPDGTIVTPSDRRVEEFLRPELQRLRPGAGILGEELASSEEGPDGLWCVDPIDGTSNYAFGGPMWAVSVGLVKGEEVLLGVVYIPALDEMFVAGKGAGASLNGAPMKPIPAGPIRPEELVSYPDRLLRMYPGQSFPGKMRHTGAYVVDAVFTAAQRFRGLVGVREKLYDIAASLCIAGEVDADIRYLDGDSLVLEPLKAPHARIEKGWMIFPRKT